MTRLITALLTLSMIALSAPVSMAQSLNTNTQEAKPEATPLSEFAPDDVQAARGKSYDTGLTINKVTIEGNKLIEAEKIRDTMTLKPGSLYSKSNLSDDLRRIYDMGYFTEKIKAVPIATNKGIVIRIEVQENAPVTGINIKGNTVITDAELQQIFEGQTGLPQNIGQLNEGIEKVEKT